MTQLAANTLTRARRDMIDAGGRLYQILGLPRSAGQIYGLLYLSTKPLSLDDLVELLGISKGSASTGTRQLTSWGAIRQVWIPGDRRDYFEIIAEVGKLIRGCFTDRIQPRLASSQNRLELMAHTLDQELEQGLLTAEEHKVCVNRLRNLARLQKKLLRLAPLAEKLV
jgi:DNA-binding transcriptional regulator GbsR (MarR family)